MGESQSSPYQFPDMAGKDKNHMMGFLIFTGLFAMPAFAGLGTYSVV